MQSVGLAEVGKATLRRFRPARLTSSTPRKRRRFALRDQVIGDLAAPRKWVRWPAEGRQPRRCPWALQK